MKKLNSRLIISDFDGTLADSEHKVAEPVKRAISEYVENGGIFAVCTGRIMASILPVVRGLGLKGLVVACQGTVIAEIESGKILKCGGFGAQETALICEYLESENLYFNAYFDDAFITNLSADDENLQLYESITGVKGLHTQGKVSDFVRNSGKIYQKIAMLCYPEERISLLAKLKKKFGDKYDIASSANVLVEISPAGETKGAALKFLANYYGIPIEKTVAVGDNMNDISMICAAGIGVAVGNAVEELIKVADFVAPTNDDGGVAEVINKFGYTYD